MPQTTNFGLEYEIPLQLPGVTLTGGPDGTSPILAEQVDTVLANIDARVSTNEGDVAALQSVTPSDTGWLALSLTAGSGFDVDESFYRRWGPFVGIRILVTRTGSAITATSAGNVVGDPTICTIDDSELRPDQRQSVLGRGFTTSGAIDIHTSGAINLADMHSDSTLSTDDTIRIETVYFVSTFN